jgi:hypothetical protein
MLKTFATQGPILTLAARQTHSGLGFQTRSPALRTSGSKKAAHPPALAAYPLIHFILSSYKLLRQLYPQMFGKTNVSELPLPVSKAQPYVELFTLRFVWRQVGVKAR